jgi:hypothetical protein
MNADLLSDAIGKAEADAVGKAKALADRLDAKYAHADAVEFSLGLTYEFLNDIDELNDIVSSLAQCCRDKPDVWKERVAEIGELEKRLETWDACIGRLYLRAHRIGVYTEPGQGAPRAA